MARWITITKAPFDFRWPNGAVSAVTENGEQNVKDELADFAIERGFATEGKPDGSTARSTKGVGKAVRGRKPKATRQPPADNNEIDEATANLAPVDRLDGADMADDDSADDRPAVDPDASER